MFVGSNFSPVVKSGGVSAGDAVNGVSVSANKVVLGQDINETGDPAQLLTAREIPLRNFQVRFTNSGGFAAIDTTGNADLLPYFHIFCNVGNPGAIFACVIEGNEPASDNRIGFFNDLGHAFALISNNSGNGDSFLLECEGYVNSFRLAKHSGSPSGNSWLSLAVDGITDGHDRLRVYEGLGTVAIDKTGVFASVDNVSALQCIGIARITVLQTPALGTNPVVDIAQDSVTGQIINRGTSGTATLVGNGVTTTFTVVIPGLNYAPSQVFTQARNAAATAAHFTTNYVAGSFDITFLVAPSAGNVILDWIVKNS